MLTIHKFIYIIYQLFQHVCYTKKYILLIVWWTLKSKHFFSYSQLHTYGQAVIVSLLLFVNLWFKKLNYLNQASSFKYVSILFLKTLLKLFFVRNSILNSRTLSMLLNAVYVNKFLLFSRYKRGLSVCYLTTEVYGNRRLILFYIENFLLEILNNAAYLINMLVHVFASQLDNSVLRLFNFLFSYLFIRNESNLADYIYSVIWKTEALLVSDERSSQYSVSFIMLIRNKLDKLVHFKRSRKKTLRSLFKRLYFKRQKRSVFRNWARHKSRIYVPRSAKYLQHAQTMVLYKIIFLMRLAYLTTLFIVTLAVCTVYLYMKGSSQGLVLIDAYRTWLAGRDIYASVPFTTLEVQFILPINIVSINSLYVFVKPSYIIAIAYKSFVKYLKKFIFSIVYFRNNIFFFDSVADGTIFKLFSMRSSRMIKRKFRSPYKTFNEARRFGKFIWKSRTAKSFRAMRYAYRKLLTMSYLLQLLRRPDFRQSYLPQYMALIRQYFVTGFVGFDFSNNFDYLRFGFSKPLSKVSLRLFFVICSDCLIQMLPSSLRYYSDLFTSSRISLTYKTRSPALMRRFYRRHSIARKAIMFMLSEHQLLKRPLLFSIIKHMLNPKRKLNKFSAFKKKRLELLFAWQQQRTLHLTMFNGCVVAYFFMFIRSYLRRFRWRTYIPFISEIALNSSFAFLPVRYWNRYVFKFYGRNMRSLLFFKRAIFWLRVSAYGVQRQHELRFFQRLAYSGVYKNESRRRSKKRSKRRPLKRKRLRLTKI